MPNPFEALEKRLSVIQDLLIEIKHGTTTTPLPDETGGIDLAHQVTGLSNARIYALVSAREIPHAKRGNRLYFNRAELTEWIRQGRREERKEPKATRTNRHV